jgi:hypothetical protein
MSRPAKAMTALDLDAPCGEHFCFRDFVECGDTWHRLRAEGLNIDNAPVAAATFEAMRELCRVILDPVSRRFGLPQLTYAFASPALTKHIGSRICPSRDQHAGHELNHRGALICRRSGMAVDLRVSGVASRTLAAWIAQNTAFDRLYVYGPDQPIHISIGPERASAIVEMTLLANGRRVPRVLRTLS